MYSEGLLAWIGSLGKKDRFEGQGGFSRHDYEQAGVGGG